MATGSDNRLRAENDELRLRLEEAEQALEAIRTGQVESLVIERPDGPRIFTLEGATHTYRVLVESMNEGAVTLNDQATVLYCNARFAAMLGRPLQHLMGCSLHELVPERSRAAFDAFLRTGRASSTREEFMLVAADGEEIPTYLSVSSIVDDGLRVHCLVATDLREQRRTQEIEAAERAARESEEQLRLALEYAAAGSWAWDVRSGAVLWSPESAAFHGYDLAAGPPTFDGWQEAVHPEDRARLKAEVDACLAAQEELRVEYRVGSPAGRERWILCAGRVERAPDGAPLRLLGLHVDVTARKRAEEELSVLTRLYAVLSHVNEAIVRTRDERSLHAEVCRIVAEDGGFPLVWVGLVEGRAVVPCAASGAAAEYVAESRFEIDGVLGQGPTGTCVREGRPVINDDFGTNPRTVPWRQATEKHGLRASAAFPLRRQGEVIGAITFYAARPGAFTAEQTRLLEALCADVSYALDAMRQERLRTDAERALRESEQSLREADRRKDEFLGMLSHELRNPLAPIRNSSYVLRHADPGSAQAHRAQAIIERQTEHLTRLVDDLLDVTRIARGKIALRLERTDLRDLVRRAGEDFRSSMEDRGVAFEVTLSEEKLWADADATRVTQVIGNLLQNSVKFTRRGDEVALSLAAVGAEAEIRVRDTGAGIEAELLEHLFEPFVQGDRTLARSAGGLGLGLALVKGIAELHGGTVRAASAGVGQGAEFVVRLPVLKGEGARERSQALAATGRSGRRVLVVDDNVDAAHSLAEVLAMQGHAVDVALDGPSAIEKARLGRPDVVLCDLGLPGMSGYELARRIRAEGLGPVRLFAVSGYTQPEDVNKAVEAGFDGHLAKPFDPEQIERLLS